MSISKVVLQPWKPYSVCGSVPLFYDESDMFVASCGFVDANVNRAAYIDPEELAAAQSIVGSSFYNHEYGNCPCNFEGQLVQGEPEDEVEDDFGATHSCPQCGCPLSLSGDDVIYCLSCGFKEY